MKRDNGIAMALGATVALAALGHWGKRSAGSMAKDRPSEQQVQRGRLRRQIKRAADQQHGGVATFSKIAEETGYPESLIRDEATDMVRSGGYYIEEANKGREAGVGKVSTLRQKLIGLLNRNKDRNPELGIRTVEMVIRLLPGGNNIRDQFALMETTELLESDIREALIQGVLPGYSLPERGRELSVYAQVYADRLRDRTYFKIGPPHLWQDFNIDEAADGWPGERYIGWIESLMADFIEAYRDDGPSEPVSELIGKWNAIMDWATAERADLTGMSLDDADDMQQEWHRENREKLDALEIERKKREGKWFDCPNGIHPIKGKVVYTYPNGWTWQELTTWKELQNEGNFSKGRGCLRHCIGEYVQYFNDAEAGKVRNFSLRTPENRPMLTTTIQFNNDKQPISLRELKGLSNRPAATGGSGGEGITIMRRAGSQFEGKTLEQYLDAEAKMVDDFFTEMGFPRDGGEYRTVNGRLREIREREAMAKAAAQRDGNANRWREYEPAIGGFKPKSRRNRVKRGRR